MSPPNTQGPIKLVFEERVYVAGETIAGRVDLNVALAREMHVQLLWIKFRGGIRTSIANSKSDIEFVPLFREKKSLWTSGSAAPKAGSQTLSCPFEFQVPENSPPSFHCSSGTQIGTISYSLEATAERRGHSSANYQLRRLISVVPAATPEQLEVKGSLLEGWTGEWRNITEEKKMRNGMRGEYSLARVILSLPDSPAYPIRTPIPFKLQISTETKLVRRSDLSEKPGKPLFPAPPTDSSQLKQVLRRVAEISVGDKTCHQTDTFDLPLIRGLRDADTQRIKSLCKVQVVVVEPEWIPKEENRGIWKRSVQLTSKLLFPFPPSEKTSTLEWEYELHFVIPFPGFGNDLKVWTPIQLCGSSNCTESTKQPLHTIVLPSAYWSGKDHNWGDNAEDGGNTAGSAADMVDIANTVINGLLTSLNS